ncbi:MAG: DUF1593 domain-containing protein [Candidatus Latescibacteria bacterium]|nr:DUF1593 domain-containing protein [Candidatus Latescibacterota bacterium]
MKSNTVKVAAVPRLIVTTDINAGAGDPDDRQSLCHLLYYASELDIRAIVPDRFSETGTIACTIAFDLYEKDYLNPRTKYRDYGYPAPDYFRHQALVADREAAVQRIVDEATGSDPRPLWVLAWGNLEVIGQALRQAPQIKDKVRLITIGTFLRARENGGDGQQNNWNGRGRQYVFDDHPDLWWLEIDWTYNGMFPGVESVQLKEDLAAFGGDLGQHIKDVIGSVDWADNFRAGDTPTVLYLIDPDHDLDDPTVPSWAGRYMQPFPLERPNYWTDITGGYEWDFADPARTWENASSVYQVRVATLLERRPAMYAALLAKVKDLYGLAPEAAAERLAETPLPVFVQGSSLVLEAEEAEYSGDLELGHDGAASNGAMLKTRTSGSIVWRFDSQCEPGEFAVGIRYRLPRGADKQTVFINSANLGQFEFSGETGVWLVRELTLFLERGRNSVVLQTTGGDMEVDALVVGEGASISAGLFETD